MKVNADCGQEVARAEYDLRIKNGEFGIAKKLLSDKNVFTESQTLSEIAWLDYIETKDASKSIN